MKLSIITCTYNSEKHLQECIDSVIAQNLDIKIYEHIFVDAYSTDNTKEIIEGYKKNYSNVKMIERKPKGVYNAMNEGIKEAKGEYIMCLNSDDFLVSDVLNNYISFIKKTGDLDLYYGILNYVSDGKIEPGSEKFISMRKWLFKNFGVNLLIIHPTCLVKRNTLLEMGLFEEDKKISSDYGMRLKMLYNKKTFSFFPNHISNFRVRSGSLSSSKMKGVAKKERNYYRSKYFSFRRKYVGKFIEFILFDFYGIVLRSFRFIGKFISK